MKWEKINIEKIMDILRDLENKSTCLYGENSVVYSDGKEELKITYKKLK